MIFSSIFILCILYAKPVLTYSGYKILQRGVKKEELFLIIKKSYYMRLMFRSTKDEMGSASRYGLDFHTSLRALTIQNWQFYVFSYRNKK